VSTVARILGGILGVIVGFTIGILFTEVAFSNNQSWPDVIPFALAVAGWIAGSQAGRRLVSRRAKHS
jgi:hypothetical protein